MAKQRAASKRCGTLAASASAQTMISARKVTFFPEMNDQSVRYNQYGAEVKRNPLLAESRDGILVFESFDQKYRFWFDVRVQVDGAFFFGEKEYMNPIGNGVTIRRARLGVKAQVTPNWYGEIDMDFANGEFELKDALVRFTGLDYFEFSLGNFKEDFSMSQTTTSRYLPFMERPMAVQAFAPSRHLGFDVKFRKDWAYASTGAFFQTIDNLETYTYVKDNNSAYGRDQKASWTSKIVINPLFYDEVDKGIHIGAGYSYRTPKTDVSPGRYPSLRYDVRNATSINRKKYLDTDYIPNVSHNYLYNFELAGNYKGFRVQGEYLANNIFFRQDAPAGFDRSVKKFKGWYAMFGALLFGGEQRYNSGDAKYTQPTLGREWGDIELLVRYDYLDLNSNGIYGGAGQNFTLGINYYVNQNVKFVLNYQYSDNDRYANGRGDYYIGYDAAGKPTANYKIVDAAKGKAGISYHMIGARVEIDF